MINQQNYNCPQCRQVDRVEKVSALVGAGTSAGLYGGPALGSSILVGASQTALSQKLSPPTKPTYQSPWGCVSTSLTVAGVIIGIIFLYIVVSGMQQQSIQIRSFDPIHNTLQMQISLLVGIPFGISFLIIIVNVIIARKRKSNFDTDYPRWQHAIAKWNELYYCARNDVVFLPGKPRDCVPVSQMSMLLYKP